jgi:hypothetical protein
MLNERNNASGPSDADPNVTADVGGEGGSPGDVEVGVDRGPAAGSEAGEIVRPTKNDQREIVRDESGEGRRSP